MNSEWFESVVKDQIKMCEDVLINKAKEYSDDFDRLHNFKNAAGMMGCDAKEALAGMMAKHTISIYDMCRNGKDYPIELWNEKITDHINYLLLLKAVVAEEKHGIKIPSIPVFGTYYGLLEKAHPIEPITPNDILEKVQKDPHVKYEPASGMTLMGNQFTSDEVTPKPKFDPESLDQAIQLVREHIKNCIMSGCHNCPHSCLNNMKTMSLGCTQGLLSEYDNVISRLKDIPTERAKNDGKMPAAWYDENLTECAKEAVRSLKICTCNDNGCKGCKYCNEPDCTTMIKQEACDLLEKYLAKEGQHEST